MQTPKNSDNCKFDKLGCLYFHLIVNVFVPDFKNNDNLCVFENYPCVHINGVYASLKLFWN